MSFEPVFNLLQLPFRATVYRHLGHESAPSLEEIPSNFCNPLKSVLIPGGRWLWSPDHPPKRAISQDAQAKV